MRLLIMTLVGLVACGPAADAPSFLPSSRLAMDAGSNIDDDGDGFCEDGMRSLTRVPGDPCDQPGGGNTSDCDDADPDNYRGNAEVCDNQDNNCDTNIDEGFDADGDGYTTCALPVPDCDDTLPTGFAVNPAAAEVCNLIDDDCDGLRDEDAAGVDGALNVPLYPDLDGDGYGDELDTGTPGCANALGADQSLDNLDCNDSPVIGITFNPDAPEVCDDEDHNCDGSDDFGLDFFLYYPDMDGDGFGTNTTAVLGVSSCETSLPGKSHIIGDCDDTPGVGHLINPNALEICNNLDDNCDQEIDEGYPKFPSYIDRDNDGFGDPADTFVIMSCAPPGPGRSANNDDCNDNASTISPAESEVGVCDGIDDDCNGTKDDFWDLDRDGVSQCGPAGDYIDADCNDVDPERFPGNPEVCDGKDNDCDMDVDEGVKLTFYLDGDADGYGSQTLRTEACTLPPGYVTNAADCDDSVFLVKPSGVEIVADGIDQDCDTKDACYQDLDGDGFGSGIVVSATIGCPTADSASAVTNDCDDNDDLRTPGRGEICDGIDNNCNNVIDDPSLVTYFTYYRDVDGDGFGDATDTTLVCATTPPTNFVSDNRDCDDNVTTGPGVNPNAQEIVANGIDEDCDTADDCYQDLDGDGYGSSIIRPGDDLLCDGPSEADDALDCDDDDANAYPSAPFYADCDGDGFATNTLISACTLADANLLSGCGAPTGGYVFDSPDEPDCDDNDPEEFPGQQWFADCDADGADRLDPIETCTEDEANDQSPCANTLPPATWRHTIPLQADCDDETDLRSPLLDESCEPLGTIQIDNDCDGDVNGTGPLGGPPIDASPFNQDFDRDGFGDPHAFVMACESAPGIVSNDADCDDVDAGVYLGAEEICDGRDQNCNLLIDEADFLAAENSFCLDLYRDRDGDGYGDESASECLCADIGDGNVVVRYNSEDYVATLSDCDDVHQDIKPHGCNDKVDNDRDGLVDEDDDDCDPVEVDGVMRLPVDEGTGTQPGVYVTERIDGHDNECDGFVPFIELDCDDDGSLARLPIQPTGPVRSHLDVGLAACSGAPIQVPCWDLTLDLECDPNSGLWVTRWSSSDDGFGGRYSRAFRNLTTSTCAPTGDCDDLCPDRCPGQQERCDGLDNDCSGIVDEPDTDGIPASMQGTLIVGTMSAAEVDLDGDGFAACLDDFRASDLQNTPTTASCLPTVEADRNSDCDEGCYLTNALGVEQCNGFRDVCGANTTPEGLDGDDDQHRTCGVGGPIESELTEQIFAVAWVSCATPRDGCEAVTVQPPAGSPPWVPLLLPRDDARACDAPLTAAIEPLLAAVSAPSIADLPDATALVSICAPASGGFCTPLELVNGPSVDSPENLDLALLAGTVAPDCERFPEQYHSRSVWPAERIVASRELVVEAECMRLYGERCVGIGVEQPAIGAGRPPNIDPLLERPELWWQSIGRYQPASARGALMTCWGDPIQGIGQIEDAVGGDCADELFGAHRDQPEGPDDLLGVYLGDPGDCDRCTDGIDNNCDGRTDCEDPSCAVCFVGESRGCRGTRDPCTADEEGGGCQSSGSGGSAALLLVMALIGRRTRRRA